MIKLSKNKIGNIKGSFNQNNKVYSFETQACFHRNNKNIVKKFIQDHIETSSAEHLVKELNRADDRLLAYYG